MRALVISDTHFGAWTGRDLLAEEFFLERLAPALEGIDEMIFLGDLFDFLFGSVEEAVDAADGLLRLIAAKMVGGRLVFLAGNHDHHLVHRDDDEDRLETKLASGHRLTASAKVLCTHGHYLDYESVTTLLTEWLYVAAQMPHGTHAQQNVFRAAQRAGRFAQALGVPVRGAERLAVKLRDCGQGEAGGPGPLPSEAHFDAVVRGEAERQAREQPLSGPAASRPIYPEPTVVSRSDPFEHALEAFAQVVGNLDWGGGGQQIVFAHAHQPLADVRCIGEGQTRYWNTGSWIYEPDLDSRQAYGRYLRYAWPGTAISIDEEEPQPRLLELLADLNPMNGGPGLPPL